jgi:hypothetical protein
LEVLFFGDGSRPRVRASGLFPRYEVYHLPEGGVPTSHHVMSVPPISVLRFIAQGEPVDPKGL